MTRLETAGERDSAESAVAQQSPAEMVLFRQWFAGFDGDAGDAQIEADAAAGKLDSLAEEARAEYQAGKTHEMNGGWAWR